MQQTLIQSLNEIILAPLALASAVIQQWCCFLKCDSKRTIIYFCCTTVYPLCLSCVLVFAFNNVFVSLWEVLAEEIHTDSFIMEQRPAAHWVFRIRQSTQIDQWDLKDTLRYSMKRICPCQTTKMGRNMKSQKHEMFSREWVNMQITFISNYREIEIHKTWIKEWQLNCKNKDYIW